MVGLTGLTIAIWMIAQLHLANSIAYQKCLSSSFIKTLTSSVVSIAAFIHPLVSDASVSDGAAKVRIGMDLFRVGNVHGSKSAFEDAVKENPKLEPYMWQLGLSEYIENDLQECSQQFKRDVAINPRDTEEILWAYLCDNKIKTNEDSFIDASTISAKGPVFLGKFPADDPRRIMRLIYDVYNGDKNKDNLLNAGNSFGKEGISGNYFYSRLYLGFLADSNGDYNASLELINDALESNYAHISDDYMISVARNQKAKLMKAMHT